MELIGSEVITMKNNQKQTLTKKTKNNIFLKKNIKNIKDDSIFYEDLALMNKKRCVYHIICGMVYGFMLGLVGALIMHNITIAMIR